MVYQKHLNYTIGVLKSKYLSFLFDKTVIFYRNCRNWKEFMIKSEREAKDERNRGGVNIESFRKTVCGFF
jgi:hypothetical protein